MDREREIKAEITYVSINCRFDGIKRARSGFFVFNNSDKRSVALVHAIKRPLSTHIISRITPRRLFDAGMRDSVYRKRQHGTHFNAISPRDSFPKKYALSRTRALPHFAFVMSRLTQKPTGQFTNYALFHSSRKQSDVKWHAKLPPSPPLSRIFFFHYRVPGTVDELARRFNYFMQTSRIRNFPAVSINASPSRLRKLPPRCASHSRNSLSPHSARGIVETRRRIDESRFCTRDRCVRVRSVWTKKKFLSRGSRCIYAANKFHRRDRSY